MTSVIVVTNTLEAIAGSILNFLRDTGTNIPNNPATIIVKIIEIEIINIQVIKIFGFILKILTFDFIGTKFYLKYNLSVRLVNK